SLKFISAILIASTGSFSIVYALITSLGFPHNPYYIFFSIVLFSLIFSLLFFNKLSTLIVLSVVSGLAAVFCIYSQLKGKLSNYVFNILDFLQWILNYTQGYEKYNKAYAFWIMFLLCFFITLFFFTFGFKRLYFIVLFVFGTSIFASQWILGYFVSYLPFYMFLCIILVYYMMHIFENKTDSHSSEYANRSIFALWMLPFCIIISLTAAFALPVNKKAIHWEWLDTKINFVFNYFENKYTSNSFFSISKTGFGQTSELGGRVRLDRTPVMLVDSNKRVYLRGSIKDTYTGFSWIDSSSGDSKQQKVDSSMNEVMLDISETSNALHRYPSVSNYLSNSMSVKVSYLKGLNTNSLFNINKGYSILSKSGKASLLYSVDHNGILTNKDRLSAGFSYTIDVLNIDYTKNEFKDFIKNFSTGYYSSNRRHNSRNREDNNTLYSTSDATNLDISPQDSEEASFDNKIEEFNVTTNSSTSFKIPVINRLMLTNYLNDIHKRYLQLPPSLPARVKDFAKNLTSTCKTDYDKAKAIEKYLSNNYAYTLAPDPTPKDRDFTDYFLFDLKEGYCTYYATAMTVMVRSLGIPARYVEGYALPPIAGTNGVYEVTNQQAHAWVEVYFEGFGWLPFEPTSPFNSYFYNDKSTKVVFSPSMGSNPAYEEYVRRLKGQYNKSNPISNNNTIATDSTYKSILFIGALAVPLLIVILFAFNLIRRRLRIKNFRKLPHKKSVMGLYKYYLKLLEIDGIKVYPGETPSEFAARVNKVLCIKGVCFKDISEIFIKARFSPDDVSDDEKNLVGEFYKGLVVWLSQDLGKLKFLFYRYVLGII
ncbi:MAG TPA: transglutaminase domain-containing protein, partial [Clostridia bacterium]